MQPLLCRLLRGLTHGEAPRLTRDVMEWLLESKYSEWGSWFTVISGGEPFIWRDSGSSILDVMESHPEQYFLVFTNGTLIDGDTAARLSEMGNVTPSISIEGFAEQTERRRGKGTFEKILAAMENLKSEGVPFGISATGVPENARLLLSDELLDFYMDQQGALYMWLFHYMPIGRGAQTARQIRAPLRRWMWEREQKIIRNRRLFLVDFWNGGTFSEGCIAAGRTGGYLYVDWQGHIHPCVFVPYWQDSVQDLIREGRSLTDAIMGDFFKEIRKW